MGSTEVLVVTGTVLLLGTAEVISIMVVGDVPEGFDTVGLASKQLENLARDAPPAVGVGTREASGVDMLFFLEVMED